MQNRDDKREISGATTLLLSCGAGLAVSGLYYNQPLLALMGRDFGTSPRGLSWVPTLTQLGYALGILFLTLLGDWTDRRRVILVKGILLSATLAATALAHSLPALLATSLLLGLFATMAQDIVPAAASLSDDAHRGKTVGTVMTGLLLGILLSRVASGLAGSRIGWRGVYLVASGSIALFLVPTWKALPRMPATIPVGYGKLLGSLVELWMRHPAVRRAAFAQGAVSVGFSAFWSTLAVMLQGSHHVGSDVAGAFGLAGAAGALGAPVAGRLTDRQGSRRVVGIGATLVALSFLFLFATGSLPGWTFLPALAIGTVGFDLGYQFCLISHQSLVYGLEPAARSRLNAILFVGMFLGMSAGSALGGFLLASLGWNAVLLLGAISGVATLILRPRS
jgi:predicted MFS family arabinose efflux permease